MQFPVSLIVPEYDSGLYFPYIVDADGIVVVSKCSFEDGRMIVEAMNNYYSEDDCRVTES